MKKIYCLPLIFLIGCADAPQQKVYWDDLTGNKRPDAVLFQDHSACLIFSQQARNQAETANPMPEANPCRGCSVLSAATVMMRQQVIDDRANYAYINCMGTKGWRKRA